MELRATRDSEKRRKKKRGLPEEGDVLSDDPSKANRVRKKKCVKWRMAKNWTEEVSYLENSLGWSNRTEKCDQGLVFQQDSKKDLFFLLPLSST